MQLSQIVSRNTPVVHQVGGVQDFDCHNGADHLGCNLVSHVSACWLTGLGLGTPSKYLARTIS